MALAIDKNRTEEHECDSRSLSIAKATSFFVHIRTLALDMKNDTDVCLPNRCQWRFLCPPACRSLPTLAEMEERWRQISTPF